MSETSLRRVFGIVTVIAFICLGTPANACATHGTTVGNDLASWTVQHDPESNSGILKLVGFEIHADQGDRCFFSTNIPRPFQIDSITFFLTSSDQETPPYEHFETFELDPSIGMQFGNRFRGFAARALTDIDRGPFTLEIHYSLPRVARVPSPSIGAVMMDVQVASGQVGEFGRVIDHAFIQRASRIEVIFGH